MDQSKLCLFVCFESYSVVLRLLSVLIFRGFEVAFVRRDGEVEADSFEGSSVHFEPFRAIDHVGFVETRSTKLRQTYQRSKTKVISSYHDLSLHSEASRSRLSLFYQSMERLRKFR